MAVREELVRWDVRLWCNACNAVVGTVRNIIATNGVNVAEFMLNHERLQHAKERT